MDDMSQMKRVSSISVLAVGLLLSGCAGLDERLASPDSSVGENALGTPDVVRDPPEQRECRAIAMNPARSDDERVAAIIKCHDEGFAKQVYSAMCEESSKRGFETATTEKLKYAALSQIHDVVILTDFLLRGFAPTIDFEKLPQSNLERIAKESVVGYSRLGAYKVVRNPEILSEVALNGVPNPMRGNHPTYNWQREARISAIERVDAGILEKIILDGTQNWDIRQAAARCLPDESSRVRIVVKVSDYDDQGGDLRAAILRGCRKKILHGFGQSKNRLLRKAAGKVWHDTFGGLLWDVPADYEFDDDE